ncbi:MAG: LysM peptidoglycan-binding domain-containing protein [Alphaproteobacteria bacterium]|nr:LysM peptidoglycan-binding domain-containing protein [Alphaproteobacteria bacterium]MBU1513967.1 LysM peptidoglycan-binding domain-containing protein [Alphaproteobacteria bacterium]MBU2093093.1 LysM peptidoglycan-binding domain-containing protein [Alphaproteobacteria bacterium]MBU2151704.1 LysM peptidoglycan-binding domain-containing protein [Alphaproteobacteria bacterium]MBU2309476.1 LysM peptidoglycan-binding domain-containing protein [Alphaproteobacteria bacterium]
MTHLFERTALILLAGTALTACGTPRYAVNPPLIALPPAVAPQAPPSQVAAVQPDSAPQAAPSVARVESQQLAPLAPAQPAVAQASAPPLLAFAPPAEDAFARAKARGPAATYTVKKGDTLAEIADRLDSDIETVAKANGLKKPYRLQPGQVLKNPKAPKAAAAKSTKASAAKAEAQTYTIRSGDTLYGIAQRFGTTVDALREANGLGRSASIVPGRKLRLSGSAAEERADAAEDEVAPAERPKPSSRRTPAATSPAPAPEEQEPGGRTVTNRQVTGRVVEISTPGKAYTVKKGDNLDRVASRLDSDIAELAKLNKLKKPYRLQPGQTIRGPGSSAKAYVVGRGDTVPEIARRFGVSESELRSANGLRRGASVAPGRKLRLPAGYRDRGPLTTTTRVPEAPQTEPTPRPQTQYPRPQTDYPRPPSSFDTPAPVGQTLPPPRSAPRPPQVVMPDTPQPYRTPPGGVTGAPTATPAPSDAQISQMGAGVFAWPLRGQIISSFGGRGSGPRNDGLNIRANAGDPVRAAAAGDVVYAGDQVPGFGNLVLIKHANGWVTAYGHLGRVEVRMQQRVEQGQQIGQAGSSGGVSEPQLHFEIRYAPSPQERARPVDPALVLPK